MEELKQNKKREFWKPEPKRFSFLRKGVWTTEPCGVMDPYSAYVYIRDGVAKYQTAIVPDKTGMYQVATRMYAKNPLMPHRQDFELVKWL